MTPDKVIESAKLLDLYEKLTSLLQVDADKITVTMHKGYNTRSLTITQSLVVNNLHAALSEIVVGIEDAVKDMGVDLE